jgi:hypothetical protein
MANMSNFIYNHNYENFLILDCIFLVGLHINSKKIHTCFVQYLSLCLSLLFIYIVYSSMHSIIIERALLDCSKVYGSITICLRL